MSVPAQRRAQFELLRFAAAPAGGEVCVVEVEGRFPAAGERFVRRPVLVVEDEAGERVELAAVWSRLDGERWSGIFGMPAAVLEGGRFALGVRGTLLDLPAPDRAPDGDRVAALAREGNALRRRTEEAEAAAGAAEAAADERVAEVQREADERIAAVRAEADAFIQAAQERVNAAEAHADERARRAEQQAEAAEQRAANAEQALQAAEAGIDVLRAELAEERERARLAVEELQERLDLAAHAGQAGGSETDTTVVPPPTEPPPTQPLQAAPAPDTEPSPPVRKPMSAAASPPTIHREPALSPWVAVAALGVIAFLVLGLLLGFLG